MEARFPDDWTKPGEYTFCHRCGMYMTPDKVCDKCKSGNIQRAEFWHAILSEVRTNIAKIRRKYLDRLYWMEK